MEENKISMDSLLKIEEDDKILQFRYDYKDFLMWPFIRFFCFESAIEEANNMKRSWRNKKITSIIQIVKYIFLALIYSPFRVKNHKEIIIFGTAIANVKINHTYLNRLTDFFVDTFVDNTIVIEFSNNYTFNRPKRVKRVYYHDWIRIKAGILSVFTMNSKKNISKIDNLLDYLKVNFSYKFKDENIWKEIRRTLCSVERKLPFLHKQYEKFMSRVKPKLILLEEAHYGTLLTPIVRSAHDLNIRIAEFQHGLVSKNHPAYNYGKALFSDTYKKYLPSTFLSYGDYWKENIRTPSEVIVIGNPYLSEFVKSKKNKIKQSKKTIVYISAALNPSKSVEFLSFLKKSLNENEYKLVFRPHPLERHKIQEKYSELLDRNIIIDAGDLYSLFNCTDFLIGEVSTTIFEALAFDICIFIIDNNYTRLNADIKYFNTISSAEDFFNKISSHDYKISSNTVDFFWASDWQERYSSYVNNRVRSD
jgi:hypothetical protein